MKTKEELMAELGFLADHLNILIKESEYRLGGWNLMKWGRPVELLSLTERCQAAQMLAILLTCEMRDSISDLENGE